MKLLFILPLMFILASCTIDWKDERITQQKILEEKLLEIQKENQQLKENISILQKEKSRQDSSQLDPTKQLTNPDDMKFEESSNQECVDKARIAYMESGNKACEAMGWNTEDMRVGKCKLKKEFIAELQRIYREAELACGPG